MLLKVYPVPVHVAKDNNFGRTIDATDRCGLPITVFPGRSRSRISDKPSFSVS